MIDVWHRFGRLPGWLVAGGLLVALGLWRAVEAPRPPTASVCAFVVLVSYCVAREREGLSVFTHAVMPGGVGTLAHDVFDVSRAWGLLLVPFALLAIWEIDRGAPEVAADPASSS